MRKVLLLCCICWLEKHCIAQSQPQKVTSLRIKQTEMFGSRSYSITDSTIRVERQELGIADTMFTRKITPSERDKLLAPLNHVYLFTLKYYYQGRSTNSDMPLYVFTVAKGEFVKQIKIYEYKVKWLYDVGKQLDFLLPPAFQLRYAVSADN